MLATVALPIIAQAQTITQGYDIDSDVSLQRGMVVGLKQDDPKKIEAINNSDAKRVHGVVVGSGDSSFILAEENQKVYVASAGKFDVLVSNQNGAIAPGDFVSVSQVTGIAMKTDGYQETVIGKALDGFDGTTKLSEVTIKDAIGAEQKIAIGRISVDLSIMRNPILKSTASLPSYLKDASEFIAGKPVNPVRVYLSLAIMDGYEFEPWHWRYTGSAEAAHAFNEQHQIAERVAARRRAVAASDYQSLLNTAFQID